MSALQKLQSGIKKCQKIILKTGSGDLKR